MSNHAVDCSPPTNGGVGGGRSMLRPPAVLQSKNTTFYVFEALLLEHSSGGRCMQRPYSEHLTILTHPLLLLEYLQEVKVTTSPSCKEVLPR